jgi:hypothetical protein
MAIEFLGMQALGRRIWMRHVDHFRQRTGPPNTFLGPGVGRYSRVKVDG